MKLQKATPENITIFVPGAHPDKMLRDYRILQRYGDFKFGTIEQVAKNLGISMKVVDGGLTFTAPRTKLQTFAEKLHFAMVSYRQL